MRGCVSFFSWLLLHILNWADFFYWFFYISFEFTSILNERKTAFLWLHDKRQMRISIQLLRVDDLFFHWKSSISIRFCYRLILFWPFDFECVLNDMRSLNAFAFYMVIVISQNNNHIFFPCQSFSIYHLCFYVLHLDEWNYAIFRRLN